VKHSKTLRKVAIATKDFHGRRSVSIHSNFVLSLLQSLEFSPAIISTGKLEAPSQTRKKPIGQAVRGLAAPVAYGVSERSALRDILRVLDSFRLLGVASKTLQSASLVHWFEHYGAIHRVLQMMYPRTTNCITLFSYLKRYAAYDALLKLSLRGFNRIVTTTKEFRRILASLGIDSRRITVIPLGVDTSYFRPPPDKSVQKSMLGLGQDARVITYFAQITPSIENDFRGMLEIALGAHSVDNNLKFLFCFKNLPADVARLEIPGVKFFGRVDVRSILWATDLLALPFTASTPYAVQPLTAVEALACGVPLIALRHPALEELVVDGVNGVLVSEFQELHGRLVGIVNQSSTLSTMSIEARQTASEKFDIKSVAQSYLNLWLET